ncbi:hypothetical protein ACLB2K_072978 [Fragaria x ananassa]
MYPGCKSHTKFNALLRLQNLKVKHHMSDAAYFDWVELIGDFLPKGNEIPDTYSDAKKSLLSKLGMYYEKIHACPNDCILYREKHAEAVVCPTCGASRWKVTEDYSSNISSLVSMDDLKLSNYKSHDCHTIMQQLLGIAIQGVLEKPVRIAVIRLCIFFNEICHKTIDVSRLPKIQNDIAKTLCELEKYFPPSFFTIIVHLTLHLVREVELCGPVCYRWMYPFERYMKVCKGYVRNRARSEGCMAENYIAEEEVEFLAKLLLEDKTAGIPSARDTVDRPAYGAHVVSVYGNLFDQAHLCVLQNTNEFRSYFDEHLEFLKQEFPRFRNDQNWLTDKQNKTFADWVADQMSESAADILEIVRWLSDKPSNEVLNYSGYTISRTLYTTKGKDDVRSTQNSGVYLVADTPQVASVRDKRMIIDEMSFYGVITEIWELDYEKFRIPIFKCDWVDNGRGVVCVEKIFYIQDPADPQWLIVVRLPKRDYSDFEAEDVVTNNGIIHQPITVLMSSIELSGSLSDEEELGYMRAGEEDIVVEGE